MARHTYVVNLEPSEELAKLAKEVCGAILAFVDKTTGGSADVAETT